MTRLLLILLAFSVSGCSLMSSVPDEPPPLVDMEEPLPLFDEPDDEAERRALELGAFTGVYVGDARDSLEALMGEPEGLVVERIVENSPGAAAGLEIGDLLFEARSSGDTRDLRWPADWRAVELEAEPGSDMELTFDRAGAMFTATLVPIERVAAPSRHAVDRYREEQRVGVVVRTATEVEARSVGLSPGGGAVVVGLARSSPWRAAGLTFGDLVAEVNGAPVAHPEMLLEAIRSAPAGARLDLVTYRAGERQSPSVPTSRRKREMKGIHIPLLFDYSNDGRRKTTSVLFGLFKHTATKAVWRTRLLWLISFGAGDADELVEVDV